MKILFFMRSTVYVRNFESTLRLLADRGHQVHVVADAHEVLDPTNLMGRLCAEYPQMTHGAPPVPAAPHWSRLGVEARKALDYLRYLRPEYGDSPKLRWRALHVTPSLLAPRFSQRLLGSGAGRRALGAMLRRCNEAVPPDAAVREFIQEHEPDIVLVTPLVEPGSPQSDYVRAARSLGIPTGLCVYSWDNLTSKGLIHDPLDVVTVWNQPMKDEAVTLHQVPAERVVVTGAAAYDHWFAWKPRRSREVLCSEVGLDPRFPYLLYLCSSRFIAPNEVPFIRRWVEQVRAASATLANVGVLIRPHPQNIAPWRNVDLSDVGNIAVWPRRDGNPTDEDSRADYYDSIVHSAAVVGINTSALIESAIVGRGVFTVLDPEFRATQEGTLHFRHLREVSGGLLHVAADMAEHARHLEGAVQAPERAAEPCRRFVDAFVRPYGRNEAAAPRMVAAIEATAASPARRAGGISWTALARPVLAPAALRLEQRLHRADLAEEEQKKAARRDREQRAARRLAAARHADAASQNGSRTFEHYVMIRDRVRRFCETAATPGGLTAGELSMVAALQPLWDATPETIARLRGYREVVSGVRAGDYHGEKRAVRALFERDLRRLLAKGDGALWVDEPSVLGGFGFKSGSRRYNEDTLRFYRVMSLLHDAALLKEFQATTARRTVWEVGGGWGGFAYHFKTICPSVTYLMTGKPEQFLVSAVYLTTLFPAATFRFYDPANPDAFWREWESVDFAFAPECVVRTMTPPSLDLTVDVMTLERMNSARLDQHVQRAYDLGSRHFFSVGAVAPHDEVTPVLPAVERLYWRHPVSAPESLTKRLSLSTPEGEPERTYFLGWKRLRA